MLDVKVDFVRDFWALRCIRRLCTEEGGNGYYNEHEGDATKHNSEVGD